MDPADHIRALEARVRELEGALNRAAPGAPPDGGSDHPLVDQVRASVGRAIGADSEGDIEAHVGAVWLSRLATVLTMTFLVLGARFTVGAESLGALEKVLAGFAVAALFCGYAYWQRRARDPFAQAMLGCGLAAIYFTCYALFFVEETRLIQQPLAGIAALLACLAAMARAAHAWRSQTVAGIGLFLAYYTVVLSGGMAPAPETLAYTLAICAAIAFATLLLHHRHQWLFLSWGALLATYGTFLYFFWRKPPTLAIDDIAYFWISGGFLAVCHALFSLVAISDARKREGVRGMVVPLAAVNSIIFYVAVDANLRAVYPGDAWMFRGGFAIALLAFAILAHAAAPRRNGLFQLFTAKAVVLAVWAIHGLLPAESVLTAQAGAAALLALIHRRTGVTLFKVMGAALAALVFALALASVKMAGTVDLGVYTLPANAFNAIGVASAFLCAAFFLARVPLRPARGARGFLAGSRLDFPCAALSLLHAAAAAILLLCFVILERGDDPTLPFLLAAIACLTALLGVVFFTPQIEMASVLLLVAAHVCFHVFLWLPLPGFEDQEGFLAYAIALAGMTYVGAHAFERYLSRFKIGPRDLDHHLLASIPYLAATFLLVALLAREVDALFLPPACAGLGLALLLAGVTTRYPGVVASGLLAMFACGVHFSNQIDNPDAPLAHRPDFLVFLALMLVVFAASERLLFAAARAGRLPAAFTGIARSGFVLALLLFGLLGLHAWSGAPDAFIRESLGLGAAVFILGALFHEPRYRWAGLAAFLTAIVWTLLHFDLLTPRFRLAIFGACAGMLLLVSWLYSRQRAQTSPPAAHG